jgi:uncharacterized membrane protein
MNRFLATSLTSGVLYVSLATGAFAASQPADVEKAGLVAQLQQRAARLEWQAQGTKGVPRAHLEQQRVRLKNLIKRLKAGEAVDPQEVEQLLREEAR